MSIGRGETSGGCPWPRVLRDSGLDEADRYRRTRAILHLLLEPYGLVDRPGIGPEIRFRLFTPGPPRWSRSREEWRLEGGCRTALFVYDRDARKIYQEGRALLSRRF